jgi:hypothetical protein
VYVDDATSRLMELRFVASESAFDYFASWRRPRLPRAWGSRSSGGPCPS